jgi:hypothetical protein
VQGAPRLSLVLALAAASPAAPPLAILSSAPASAAGSVLPVPLSLFADPDQRVTLSLVRSCDVAALTRATWSSPRSVFAGPGSGSGLGARNSTSRGSSPQREAEGEGMASALKSMFALPPAVYGRVSLPVQRDGVCGCRRG